MLAEDREKFISLVNKSLRRQYELIKACVDKGTYFFDYGNSFLKAVYDAGVKELSKNGIDEKDGFTLPSYVEDIMAISPKWFLRSRQCGCAGQSRKNTWSWPAAPYGSMAALEEGQKPQVRDLAEVLADCLDEK